MAHASSLLIVSALMLGACASTNTSAPETASQAAPAGGSATRGDFIPEGAAAGGSSDLGSEEQDSRSGSLNTNTQSGTRGGAATEEP